MNARALLVTVFMVCSLHHSAGVSAGQEAEALRYRGDYTWGHEVSSFCPRINSQCYWVGAGSDTVVLETLRQLVRERTTRAYESMCVVVEGTIDTDSPRDGFAADYDGFFRVARLFGPCGDTSMLTHGDLQHHRWVLESINGLPVSPEELDYLVPELDFGERMHVAGNTGCNRFTGTGVLHDLRFRIESMATTARLCGPVQNRLEKRVQSVLNAGPVIKLDGQQSLSLEASGVRLGFRREDWVR